MSTISMPKKEKDEDENVPKKAGQGRPALERFRLQVDRQTKDSYSSQAAAEKVGAAIKKAYPVVQVTIYDAEESKTTVL